ncbi:NB-ARC domain-containing protein [Dechloromonas sp. A34]|uniref:NB-ARC domain-containing protein n=1 Tax=Dechloromonas sp. A34 TaxID=447588 RepID=UPI002248A4B9|nr:NB-ARC domain-containing protein [Dechloromonas sp. A34]
MAVVYLSSTLLDLKAERAAVANWLEKNHQVKHSYVADDESVVKSCLDDIKASDVYVLIIGFRLGFVPPTDNPEGLSITQLEFRQAGRLGIPRVVLMSKGATDMSLTDFENPERYQRLKDFRSEVTDPVRPAEFNDITSLIAELSAGIQHVLAKQPVQRIPAPRLRIPQHKLVGRTVQVKAVLDGLQHGRREFAFVYLAGVGKTAVAAELIQNGEINQRFPDGVLWAHLGADPDVRRQLRKWATALGFTDEQLEKAASLEELSDLIVQAIDQRRLLLVVDDVWSTEAGEYFKLGGEGCAYVVTTRFPKVARELMPTVGQVITVPTLDDTDGLALLAEFAPNSVGLAPDLLRQLVGRVGGLPIALVLIGNMLKAEGDNEHAVRSVEQYLVNIAAMFRRKKPLEFVEDHNFTLGEVIEASYIALGKETSLNEAELLPGDVLRGALEALSVLRPDPSWFSSSLAEQITGTSTRALVELANAGLIDEVRYDDEHSKSGNDRRYSMHRVIAEYIRTKLPTERAQALNRLAAAHYLARLQSLEQSFQEGDDSSYGAMYRYENPEWQDCQDNWLYYFSQTGYDSEASLSFLHVWFDGFWWWSCFTDEGFDFCDELLLEWENRLSLTASDPSRSAADPRLERRVQGLDLLHRFKRAYPKETVDRNSGSWPEVAETIHALRGLSALDGDAAQLQNASARHVRALTDIFLAEAARFGERDVKAAEALYREALSLFRQDDEQWNIAWILFHLADTLGDAGDYEAIPPLCAESLALGLDGGDHEVVALDHQLLGDVAFARGDAAGAIEHYALAIEHAYRFQVEPRDPDDYTLQFYADLAARVAEGLLAGADGRPGVPEAIASGLRRRWIDAGVPLAAPADEGALLAGVDGPALVRQLFPEALDRVWRNTEGATYAKKVREHLAQLEAMALSAT